MTPTFQHIRGRQDSGQAAVETALVMPLFVFLILGVLQLGLIAQTRIMAKYAAYRAVRIGAMHNASESAMQAAAIFHMLPVWVNRSGTIGATNSTGAIISKYTKALLENSTTIPGAKMLDAVICGPTLGELRGTTSDPLNKADQRSMHGRGSSNEVDFDDPDLQRADEISQTGKGIRTYNRLRLRVQLQILYRMPIPFANWIISKIYVGSQLPSILMMKRKTDIIIPKTTKQALKVRLGHNFKVYTVPINVSYAMRMQSNFFLNRNRLPSQNNCIHYAP